MYIISDKIGYEIPFRDLDASNIESIEIVNLTRDKIVTLDDKKDILHIVKILEKIKLKKPLTDVLSTENPYFIYIYFKEGKREEISVSNPNVSIGGKWYLIDSKITKRLENLYDEYS